MKYKYINHILQCTSTKHTTNYYTINSQAKFPLFQVINKKNSILSMALQTVIICLPGVLP